MRRYETKGEAFQAAEARTQRGYDQAVVEHKEEFYVGSLNNKEIHFPKQEAWIFLGRC